MPVIWRNGGISSPWTQVYNTLFTLSQEKAEMSVSDVFILLGQENEVEAE